MTLVLCSVAVALPCPTRTRACARREKTARGDGYCVRRRREQTVKGDGEEDENHRRRRPLCHRQGVRPSQLLRPARRLLLRPSPVRRAPVRTSLSRSPSTAQHCARAARGIERGRSQGRGGGGMHARKGARALGLMSTPSLGLCSWRPRLMPARTPTHMHAHHGHSTRARRRHQTRSSTPSAKSSVTRTMLTSPRASGSTRCLRQSERLRALAPARWQSLGVAGGCALVCVGIFWRLHA